MSSSPTPHLSEPKLYTSSEIKSNPSLAKQITHLVNCAFYRSEQPSSDAAESKWDDTGLRFPSTDALHAMLRDERSVMAVIFDTSSPSTFASTGPGEEEGQGLLVACAAAIPWAGGWHKEGASTEHGWEIKTVCVHEDAKYLRKGLAVRLLGFLEEYLVGVEKREAQVLREGKVALWILAAECINGVYWRKRGYEEVRRRREGSGVWGCKTEFDMVVLKREVGF